MGLGGVVARQWVPKFLSQGVVSYTSPPPQFRVRSNKNNYSPYYQGIYTMANNGYSYVGEYRIGSLWNGTMKEKDGTIDYKVVNWKKIKKSACSQFVKFVEVFKNF